MRRLDCSNEALSVASLDSNFVSNFMPRCASVYDRLCGPILHASRREAILSDIPILSKVERLLSPIATARLGFRTDLAARPLLERARLQPLAARKVNRPKIWTLVDCRRDD
jgi:hypothetical protein